MIRAQPSKTADEKRKMMEILKRFEEDKMNDEDLMNEEDEEESGDRSDLAARLANLDLSKFPVPHIPSVRVRCSRGQIRYGRPGEHLGRALAGATRGVPSQGQRSLQRIGPNSAEQRRDDEAQGRAVVGSSCTPF